MASIQVPVSDEKIIALLEEDYGLSAGKGRIVGVEVEMQPRVENSVISHIASVKISFGLQLGVVEDLVGF